MSQSQSSQSFCICFPWLEKSSNPVEPSYSVGPGCAVLMPPGVFQSRACQGCVLSSCEQGWGGEASGWAVLQQEQEFRPCLGFSA